MAIFHVEPIGTVASSRLEPIDDGWDNETASIVISDRFEESALDGLADFSHVEVVYLFDRVAPEKVDVGARRPRGNPDWPMVGIFAQRGKNRPNRIGVTTCRLIGVQGRVVTVAGLDAIDGTPVLDIKPYFAEFGPRGDVHQPDWTHQLMRQYWS
ncbi:SAM-dependent methyltransferase [Mycolicibacterium sp. CBM1]